MFAKKFVQLLERTRKKVPIYRVSTKRKVCTTLYCPIYVQLTTKKSVLDNEILDLSVEMVSICTIVLRNTEKRLKTKNEYSFALGVVC